MNNQMELTSEQTPGVAPQEQPASGLQSPETLSMEPMWGEQFKRQCKMAAMLSGTNLVPKAYQGKKNDCYVAIAIADRMGIEPIFVMQNLVVVNGNPAWNGQAAISLVNNCGKFENDLDFVYVGEPGTMEYGCYCKAVRKSDGRELIGTTVTMNMAQGEGWLGKTGSKWKTMPDQMMKYRAASFFARAFCPDVLMGFQTAEEVEDISREPEKTTIKVE